MTDSFWPDAKTSIVLLPSGPQGESLLALAAEWTKMGMLGPALWVQPERFVPEPGAPPHIDAMVLGVGRDQEIATVHIDLFEALAQEALAVVRLVKLRSAVPSRALDAEQDAIAERVRDYVRRSMPMPNPAANISEQATDLKHVTLICAPTEFQLQQRVDWTSGEYGVVVVASPEDRSSPWSGDAFVRENSDSSASRSCTSQAWQVCGTASARLGCAARGVGQSERVGLPGVPQRRPDPIARTPHRRTGARRRRAPGFPPGGRQHERPAGRDIVHRRLAGERLRG